MRIKINLKDENMLYKDDILEISTKNYKMLFYKHDVYNVEKQNNNLVFYVRK